MAIRITWISGHIPQGQNPPDLGLELVPVNKVLDAILEAIPGQPSNPAVAFAEEDEADEVSFDFDADENLEAETDLFWEDWVIGNW